MRFAPLALSFRPFFTLLLVASIFTFVLAHVDIPRQHEDNEVRGDWAIFRCIHTTEHCAHIVKERGWHDWVDKVGGIFSTEDALDRFWDHAEGMKDTLLVFAKDELDRAKDTYKNAAGQIDDVRRSAEQIVVHGKTLRAEFERAFTARSSKRGVPEPHASAVALHVRSVSAELEEACAAAFEEFEKAFPPPGEDSGHERRREFVLRILRALKKLFVEIAVRHGVSAEHIERFFEAIEGPIVAIVVIIGDLLEQHPILADIVIGCVVSYIIPEVWIFRPILNLFGFGLKGPIKGSAAAWIQSRLYGAAIPAKSWFAFLQRAAMTAANSGWWKGAMGGMFGAAFGARL